jgi:hypothetical protein
MRATFGVMALSVGLLACGGASKDSTSPGETGSPQKIAVSGTWTGIVGGLQAISVLLNETAGNVTGSGTLSNTPTGDRAEAVAGTFSSPTVGLTFTSGTQQPFNLQGNVSATAITGTLTGAGFTGDAVTLTKAGVAVAGSSDWSGTWSLVSINGVAPVPANTTILGYQARVVSRTLILNADGTGTWADSTLTNLVCAPGTNPFTLCNQSGSGTVAWTASVGILKTVRINGHLVAVKTFAKQPDGTLLKTDDSQTEIYRRQ